MEQIANGVYRLTFGTCETHTPMALLRPNSRWSEINAMPSAKENLDLGAVTYKQMASGAVFTLPFGENERIYGFGLQMKSYMQNGKKRRIRCNADPVTDTGDSHAPIPMYVSERGYAVFVDSYRQVSFYCGCAANRDKNQAVKVNEVLEAGRLDQVYAKKRQSADMIVHVPVASGAALYVLFGNSMLECVQKYNLMSGGGFVPPIRDLAALYRFYWLGTGEALLEQARMLRKDRIPVSVFGFEPSWESHAYSSTYEWGEKLFPEHEKLLSALADMDFGVNLWEQAFVDHSAPIFEEIKPYSGDYMVWNGVVPDFFLPEACEVFGKAQQKLMDEGVCGFKMDECDGSEMYSYHFSFPDCAQFPSGIDGEQYHNALGIAMQKMMNKLFHDNDRRTLGQVRASHALAASQPFVLYSDLYDQNDYMRALVNGSFCGLLWTPEMRFAYSEAELIRRLEMNVFAPQVCLNAFQVPNFPWYQFDYDKNNAGELLPDREHLTDLVRKVLELRVSLIPYLYTAYYEYYLHGTPPFRALALDYIEDPNVTDIYDQILIGDSLMAAPVLQFDREARSVYFPQGRWYRLQTGECFEGGKRYEIKAPLGEPALFAKAGSLVPFAKPFDILRGDSVFEVDFLAFGKKGQAVLYEDDGETFGYERGSFERVIVRYDGALKADRNSERYHFGSVIQIARGD